MKETPLKKRRLELGLTLEQVANKVGVGKSTVRKWENGVIEDMKRSNISKLADALQLSPLDILYMDNYEHKKNEPYEDRKKKAFGNHFANRSEALKFIMEQEMVATNDGYNLAKMTDEQILEFANGIVYLLDLADQKDENDRLRKLKK